MADCGACSSGAACGDVNNAWGKVLSALRAMKCPTPVDEKRAKDGLPEAVLPALHWVLLDYSPLVARELAQDFDLYARDDTAFVGGVLAALPRLYGYRPKLSAAQFLRKGFAEQRLLLVAEVARRVLKRARELRREERAKSAKVYVPRVSTVDLLVPSRPSFGTSSDVAGKGVVVDARVEASAAAADYEEHAVKFLADAVALGRGAVSGAVARDGMTVPGPGVSDPRERAALRARAEQLAAWNNTYSDFSAPSGAAPSAQPATKASVDPPRPPPTSGGPAPPGGSPSQASGDSDHGAAIGEPAFGDSDGESGVTPDPSGSPAAVRSTAASTSDDSARMIAAAVQRLNSLVMDMSSQLQDVAERLEAKVTLMDARLRTVEATVASRSAAERT